MRIKTTSQINTHLQDGREFAADEGAVVEVHEDDAALVGLARSLVMSGQARHHGDAGEVDEVDEDPPMIDMADSTDEAPDLAITLDAGRIDEALSREDDEDDED